MIYHIITHDTWNVYPFPIYSMQNIQSHLAVRSNHLHYITLLNFTDRKANNFEKDVKYSFPFEGWSCGRKHPQLFTGKVKGSASEWGGEKLPCVLPASSRRGWCSPVRPLLTEGFQQVQLPDSPGENYEFVKVVLIDCINYCQVQHHLKIA